MKASVLLKFNFHFSTSYTEAWPIVPGFLFLCFLLLGTCLFAQRSPGRFQAETGINISPVRRMLKDTGTYGNQSVFMSVSVPVFRRNWKTGDENKAFFLGFSDQLSYQNHSLSTVPGLIRLYQNQSRISSAFISGSKSFWVASLGANLMGDARHPESSVVLPSGTVLYRRRVSSAWSYTLGFGYNFLFGQGLGLPIAGFAYRPKPGHQLSFILPFSASYRIRHSSGVQSLFQFRPAGNVGQLFTNQFSADQFQSALFFRSRAYAAGYQGLFPLGNRLKIRFGLSILFRRRIWISNALKGKPGTEQNSYSANVRSGLLMEVGLRYIFRKKSNGSSPAPNPDDFPLDDEDLRDIDLSDLNSNEGGNTP